MYCPQCATANPVDVKFCRSCGFELETVAAALTKPRNKKSAKAELTADDWVDNRIKGVSGIIRGSILMAVSLLLILPFALFLPASFDAPWILIWMVFFGWMTVWGGIEVAYGLSGVLESKSKLRLMGSRKEIDGQQREVVALKTGSHHRSVTEGTTRQLND